MSNTPARTTARGTPCARSWEEDWVDHVEQRETDLDRRICGAKTIGGTPCTLPSDHASGRCRHHGGFPLTGAPKGNRNGVLHDLYSRRVMVCGTHCPVWQSCPMGGGAGFEPQRESPSPSPAFGEIGTHVERRADEPGTSAPSMSFPRRRESPCASDVTGARDFRSAHDRQPAADSHASRSPTPSRSQTAVWEREGVDGEGGSGFQPQHAPDGVTTDPHQSDESPEGATQTSPGQSEAPPWVSGAPLQSLSPDPETPPHAPGRTTEAMTYAQHLMRLPPSERPQCPFELSEYQAVVTDVQRRTRARESNAMGIHLAHTVALLTVMVSRAGRALVYRPLIDKFEQTGENSYTAFDRQSAALVAFEKLAAELRRWQQHIERYYSQYATPDAATVEEHRQRLTWDTSHDPDAPYAEFRSIEDSPMRGPKRCRQGASESREAVSAFQPEQAHSTPFLSRVVDEPVIAHTARQERVVPDGVTTDPHRSAESPEGATQTSPGQSEAPPWVSDAPLQSLALKGRTRVSPDPKTPDDAAPPHATDTPRPGGKVRDAYEASANGDGIWAAFDALNDLLDRAEPRDKRRHHPWPLSPPGDPHNHGPAP